MFTGITEETGTVLSVRGSASGVKIDISAARVLEGTSSGDSIAVNGVCLTVEPGKGHFTADAMPETLRRTSLYGLHPGSKVNLERAVQVGGRLGGHIVTGHVDACGKVLSVSADGIARRLRVEVPREVSKYIAVKGSVALDGVSLTVVAADSCSLEVSLIPHTLGTTTLGLLNPGNPVNVEVDVLARYVERLFHGSFPGNAEAGEPEAGRGSGLTFDFLTKNGF